jgi:hypothetical protein
MKFIQYGLVISIFALSHQLSALECEVSYKAKRVITKKYILRDISNPEYKAGIEEGAGSTLALCEDDALQVLREDKWEITYSSAKEK